MKTDSKINPLRRLLSRVTFRGSDRVRNGYAQGSAARRYLVMGIGSLLIHCVVGTALFLGVNQENSRTIAVHLVEVRRVLPREDPAVEENKVDASKLVEPPRLDEPVEQNMPEVVDLMSVAPVSLETAEKLAELVMDADIVDTSVPIVENAIITQGGGLGSGADEKMGDGNSWGVADVGSGTGGGPGFGGGSGGGYSGEEGSSRGRSGNGGDGGNDVAYMVGTPGIVPPGYASTPQPRYPASAKSRGEQGTVFLKVEILVNGRVGFAEVAESSGYKSLDDAALEAVKRWRFKPAMKGTKAVICLAQIPVRFELR